MLLWASGVGAADLIMVTPVTERILELTVHDGRGVYPGAHETTPERIEEVPLDVKRAALPASWTIASASDPAYRKGLRPVKIGRKSKGRDCVTETVPAWKQRMTLEHRIYVVLPRPMQPGRTYSIRSGGLFANGSSTTVTFDPGRTRSEAVHASQVGYAAGAATKVAYVSAWLGDLGPLPFDDLGPLRFRVVDRASGASVYEGPVTVRRRLGGSPDSGQADEASHWRTDVWECEFSSVTRTGEYVVSVDRLGTSFPFTVGPDAYRTAFLATLKGMYHQRCGTALTEPYTRWTRSVCHHPDQRPVFQSTIRRMDRQCDACKDVEATTERREIHGGYHDAGDWDREEGHVEVPRLLAFAYELFPKHFSDGEGNIPESGNGLPDILDEAMWGCDYYVGLQRPDGGVSAGLFLDSFPDPGEGPAWDAGTWYCYAEEPVISFKHAASACHVAFALQRAGRSGTRYVESAQRAFAWAQSHLRPGDAEKIRDVRHHAAACLYRATGGRAYHELFKRDLVIATPDTPLAIWAQHDQAWAVWVYLMTDPAKTDPALRERLRAAARKYARTEFIDSTVKRTERAGLDWYVPLWWGTGAVPRSFPAMFTAAALGDTVAVTAMQTDADFRLGANPLSMCWITGTGSRSPERVFHPDSWYSPMGPAVAPGIVPEGPFKYGGPANEKSDNGPWSAKWVHASAYPDAKDWPPLELYFEARTCYPMNEFTIWQVAAAAASYGALCADRP